MSDGANIFEGWLGPGPANFVPLTPTAFLARSAAIYPDRTAVIHGERRISYRELDARAHRLASALAARGIGAGDTVAVVDRKSTRLNSSHSRASRMPSSA